MFRDGSTALKSGAAAGTYGPAPGGALIPGMPGMPDIPGDVGIPGDIGIPGSGGDTGIGCELPACTALLTSVPALAIGGAVIGDTIGTAPGMFGTGIGAYRTPGSGATPGNGGGVGNRGWLPGAAAIGGAVIRGWLPGAAAIAGGVIRG